MSIVQGIRYVAKKIRLMMSTETSWRRRRGLTAARGSHFWLASLLDTCTRTALYMQSCTPANVYAFVIDAIRTRSRHSAGKCGCTWPWSHAGFRSGLDPTNKQTSIAWRHRVPEVPVVTLHSVHTPWRHTAGGFIWVVLLQRSCMGSCNNEEKSRHSQCSDLITSFPTYSFHNGWSLRAYQRMPITQIS